MVKKEAKRILLADSDARVRAALRMLFSYEPGVTIVGESSNAKTLVERAKDGKPDIILLDWESANGSAGILLPTLRQLQPKPMILVLSGRSESELRALKAGADVFISKTDPPDTLLDIVRALGRVGVGDGKREET
jgi:DNA-binding NarL/FixJ family response regulator